MSEKRAARTQQKSARREALGSGFPNFLENGDCKADGELMHSEKPTEQAEAAKICYTCRVAEECLIWSLEHREPYGVWGGWTERQRRAFLRKKGTPVPGDRTWTERAYEKKRTERAREERQARRAGQESAA